jgi:adenine-specific DNA methylase
MKYMGSKRAMLRNGLGHLLEQEVASANRFVDLFAGSGAVAAFVARRFPLPVLAVDLQQYSVTLAEAVIGREVALDGRVVWGKWHASAQAWFDKVSVPRCERLTRSVVADYRKWSAAQPGVVTQAYGGHYFSPEQATWIDALRANLPRRRTDKTVALAALIHAASNSAAAPGHTAQPFQPTRTAKRFLEDAWKRNILDLTRQAFEEISQMFAQQLGHAEQSDANKIVATLRAGDLVFIDPPYSGVHYSRFYHVLETIAVGECGAVSGVGRYPAPRRRPRSQYSLKGESADAFEYLLRTLSGVGATAIVTFPNHRCSNGLSGNLVREIAQRHFRLEERSVKSTFSTLGGTRAGEDESSGRAARLHADELILVLRPKVRWTGAN